jgi:predicted nucleic acid-binding protein
MTLVVADTGPLRYLILVRAIDVLPKLYDAIVIPGAVLSELQHPSAPVEVRTWTTKLPGWITVRSPAHVETNLHLGLGELEAIALTEELRAAAVLLDDRHAREVADAKGLRVAGTLGVLEQAAVAGLLDLRATFERLHLTNFRGDERLFAEALARMEKRQKA